MGKDFGIAAQRNAGVEVRIQPADKTALVRGLFQKYAPEPKNGTKQEKQRRFKGWSDIDSFDAVERCLSANKAVAKTAKSISKLTGEPEDLGESSVCPDCKVTFFNPAHLRYHKQFIAHEESPEMKSIADVGSSDPSTGMLFCPWCPLLLQGPLLLIPHMKACREKRNHPVTIQSGIREDLSCSDCQTVFSKEDDLWRHIYVTHGRPHKCNRCSREFTSKKEFKLHIVVCIGEGKPQCTDCLESFLKRRELLRHITLTPHCKLAEPYVCGKCHISLANRKLILSHLWKHARIVRSHVEVVPKPPSPPETAAPIEQEPFDPFKVPDFFKPRLPQKPPEPFKSLKTSKELEFEPFQPSESVRQPELGKTPDRPETSDLVDLNVPTDHTDAFEGFDNDTGQNSEETIKASILHSKLPIKKNKEIICFLLDHPYSLPSSEASKSAKKGKSEKSSSSKKSSPSKKTEGSSSSDKKGEDVKKSKSKKKRQSTGEKVTAEKKPPTSENKPKKKSRLKKEKGFTVVYPPSEGVAATQSALPQEGPSLTSSSQEWEDDVGVMPMIQSVTSINDWNALPDASEPPSPMKKPRKKKKKKSVAIDENVLNLLKETGQDPSAYEFVFFSDSDDKETDFEPETSYNDEPSAIREIVEPTPATEPVLAEEPIPAEKPIYAEESMPTKEPILTAEPFPSDEFILVTEPVPDEEQPMLGLDPMPVERGLNLVANQILLDEPILIDESTPVETIFTDSEELLSLTTGEETTKKQIPTIVAERRKDILPNYDNIPILTPLGNEPTDVCLIDPWDANLLINSSNNDSFKPKTNTLMLTANSASQIPLIFDPTQPTQTLVNQGISLLKDQGGRNNITATSKIVPLNISNFMMKNKGSTTHWIPLTTTLTNQGASSSPLHSVAPQANDTGTAVSSDKSMDFGLLSLAVAAEAVSRTQKKGDLQVYQQPNVVQPAWKEVMASQSLEEIANPLDACTMPAVGVKSKILRVPKETFSLILAGNYKDPGPCISEDEQTAELNPSSAMPTIQTTDSASLKGAPSVVTLREIQISVPECQPQSVVQKSRNISVVLKPKMNPDAESSQYLPNLGASSDPNQAKLHEENRENEKPKPSGSSCRKSGAENNEGEKEVGRRNSESSEASLNDDDFPYQPDSDWDLENPASPSYSFVDDGDDFSPVNAHSDSFMNNSVDSSENVSSPEKAALPEAKIVLKRLDDSLEVTEKGSDVNSEVIRRDASNHVCDDCGRSFKNAIGWKIHRRRGSKGCNHLLSSYFTKIDGMPKPLRSPGKNRSVEERSRDSERIQAELRQLSSSLNDILPEIDHDEPSKPQEDKGESVTRSELTCECCNRTFKFSLALNIHRSKMLVKKLAQTNAKKKASAEKVAAQEDQIKSPEINEEVAVTVGFDMGPFSGDAQSQSSDTESDNVSNLIHILDKDLDSVSEDRQPRLANDAGKEVAGNVEAPDKKSNGNLLTPQPTEFRTKMVFMPALERKEEIPESIDDIIIDVSEVLETARASLPHLSTVENTIEKDPLTITLDSEELKKVPRPDTNGADKGEPKVYVCSFCYRKFFTFVSLKSHLLWEKKRELRRSTLKKLTPDEEATSRTEESQGKTGANQIPAAAPSCNRRTSLRKSSNKASRKNREFAKSDKSLSLAENVARVSQSTEDVSKLVSESAVELNNITEPDVKPITASKSLKDSEDKCDSAVKTKTSTEPTVELETNSESIVESKSIPESSESSVESELVPECAVGPKTDLETAAKSETESAAIAGWHNDKTLENKESLFKPESEEQFFNEISQKILESVESGLKSRSPQKSTPEKEEDNAYPLGVASESTTLGFTSTEKIEVPISANKVHVEGTSVIDLKIESEFSASSCSPALVTTLPKAPSSPQKKLSPSKVKTEAFKISRSGRRIKKKKRFGVDDNFGFIPKPVKPLPYHKKYAEILANSRNTPVATDADTSLGTDFVAPECATPVSAEDASPVAKEDATAVASEKVAEEVQQAGVQPCGIERPYKCSGCSRRFATKQQLGGHRRGKCRRNDTFVAKTCQVCPCCNKLFKTKNSLIVHRRLEKNSQVRPMEPLTSPEASPTNSFVQAKRSNGGRAIFSCKVCGRIFQSAEALKTHKWHRLKPGSSKTLCIPIGMKSLRSTDRHMRKSTLAKGIVTSNISSRLKKRRRGMKSMSRKLVRSRLKENAPEVETTTVGTKLVCDPSAVPAIARLANDVVNAELLSSPALEKSTVPGKPQPHDDEKQPPADGSVEQTFYPCTCFRVFSSKEELSSHRLQSDHAGISSLSTPENNSRAKSPAARGSAKKNICEKCGRRFGTLSALGMHKFHAANRGGTCIPITKKPAEGDGVIAVAEEAGGPNEITNGEGSAEASFESARDDSADVSFQSAKGDAELPAESASGDVITEALAEPEVSTTSKGDPVAVQSSWESVCQLCHRSFKHIRALKLHLWHRDRRGYCGLDTSASVAKENTEETSSLSLENDDTNDSSVAPSLPFDESSQDLDISTRRSLSQKNLESLQENDCSDTSLHTSEGDSRSELRRSRSSKGKKMIHLKSLYQCDLCSTNYSYLKSLFRHVETAHGNADLECKDCKMVFNSVQGLQIHVMTKETKLFKSAFEPVKPSEIAEEEFAPMNDPAKPEETSLPPNGESATAAVDVNTNSVKRRYRRKKSVANEREEDDRVDSAVPEEKKSAMQDALVEEGNSEAAPMKPDKRRERKRKTGLNTQEVTGVEPTQDTPAESAELKKSVDPEEMLPNSIENDSVTPSLRAPTRPRKGKKTSGDGTTQGEETSVTPTLEALAKGRKRKRTSEDQNASKDPCLTPTMETPSKLSKVKKKKSDDARNTEDESSMTFTVEAQAPSDEKEKPEVAEKEEESSPSNKAEKRKVDESEGPCLLPSSEVAESTPVKKKRNCKAALSETDGEVPQSPNTPSRTLRSNARSTPVGDVTEGSQSSPTPTRTVTFILSFETKHVRFVSLKCYPQQPPNPIVHCSKCKECMRKEQIKDHDCDSNHFICMCHKCRLHFPYDQYSLMDSNSKRRLLSTPENSELDEKLKTVSTDTPETYPFSKCPTSTLLIESNKTKKCALCGEVMDSFSKLEKHLMLVHTKLLTCLKCGTCFSDTKAWENHVQLDTCSARSPLSAECRQDGPDEKPPTESASEEEELRPRHSCDSCKTVFDCGEKLQTHACSKEATSPWKLFRCTSCSSWFPNEPMLQTHKADDCIT